MSRADRLRSHGRTRCSILTFFFLTRSFYILIRITKTKAYSNVKRLHPWCDTHAHKARPRVTYAKDHRLTFKLPAQRPTVFTIEMSSVSLDLANEPDEALLWARPSRMMPECYMLTRRVVFLRRGRFPEWYNKLHGHLCAAEVARIRDSFTLPTDKWDWPLLVIPRAMKTILHLFTKTGQTLAPGLEGLCCCCCF